MIYLKKKIFWGIFPVFILFILFFIKINFHIDIKSSNDEKSFEYGETINVEKPEIYLRGKYLFKNGFLLNQKYLSENDDINKQILGEYSILYDAKFLVWHSNEKDVINIVDTCPPSLSLLGHNPVKLLPIETYQEEGFAAVDNYDGDISSKVLITTLDDKIVYSVEDSSGNKTEKIRNIIYYDPNPPVITLKGESELNIYRGNTYSEQGYTAVDDCAGDITDRVKIETSLNTDIVGDYIISYSVEDDFNNICTIDRIVHVIEAPVEEEALEQQPEEVKGTIFLTFDDGPGKYTEQLLDVLNKYNVKATFFVVNGTHNSIMKRIVDEGHAIGIHSYTHDYKTIYSSEDAFFDDLYSMQKVIFDETGITTTLMRFPGGSSNTISRKYCNGIMSSLAQKVTDLGFQYFDWNVSSGDAGGTTKTDIVVKNVINGVSGRENTIVLQHDIKEFSVNAVEQIILWGLENGYKFDSLSMDSFYSHHHINN